MQLQKTVYGSLCSLLLFTGCVERTERKRAQEVPLSITITPKKIVNVKKKKKTVSEKKEHFKKTLIPIAVEVFKELEKQYVSIQEDIKNKRNTAVIEALKKEYKVENNEMLLHALKPHPISIVLAQAAAESAWLTSRFTTEANNIFGVWSFNKNEPRIAASGMRGDKTIYLKKYSTLKEAVVDYYKNLGKNWAYAEFRKQRRFTENPYLLVNHLEKYSEKKEKYTKLLKSMIRYNKFEQYDIQGSLKKPKKKPPIVAQKEKRAPVKISLEKQDQKSIEQKLLLLIQEEHAKSAIKKESVVE